MGIEQLLKYKKNHNGTEMSGQSFNIIQDSIWWLKCRKKCMYKQNLNHFETFLNHFDTAWLIDPYLWLETKEIVKENYILNLICIITKIYTKK